MTPRKPFCINGHLFDAENTLVLKRRPDGATGASGCAAPATASAPPPSTAGRSANAGRRTSPAKTSPAEAGLFFPSESEHDRAAASMACPVAPWGGRLMPSLI